MDEFRAAFERFGELCSSRHYGVPPINPKPASSSAFVNFCRSILASPHPPPSSVPHGPSRARLCARGGDI